MSNSAPAAERSLAFLIKEDITDTLSALKKEPKNLKAAFSEFFSALPSRGRRFTKRDNVRLILITFLSTVIIALVLSLLCSLKQGGLDLFMTAMIPFSVVSMIFFLFMIFYESSLPYAASSVILIMLGFAFQTMLQLPAKEDVAPAVTSLVINAALGVALGLIALPFLFWIFTKMDKKAAVILLLAASAVLYLLLLAAAPSISGTRAWLYIGGRSFQITEITKILAVMGIAAAFTDEKIPHTRRLVYALLTLLVHAVCLILINELGTLVVISIVFVTLGFAYLPKLREFIITLIIGITGIALLVGASMYCYRIYYGEPETTAVSEEAAEDAEYEDDAEEAEAPAEHGALYNKIVGKAANIFYKIRLRFILVLDPDSVDPYGDGYQSAMARRALWVTNWFGTRDDFEQHVPVIESDYIFLYVLMKTGIAGALLIVSLLIFMLFITVIKAAKTPHTGEGAVSIGFTCCIVVQSVITAASSVGLIPTVGLTFAFLSDGGSATVVNYLMTFFILFAMRRELPAAKREKNTATETEKRGSVCRIPE